MERFRWWFDRVLLQLTGVRGGTTHTRSCRMGISRASLRAVGCILVPALVLAIVPGSLWADETLSLPQLLQEARRANPTLLAAHKRWEAVQAKVLQAKALPAPKIGIEFEEIPRGTIKVNQATVMYQLIQALPFPGKLSLRHQVAVKNAQVAAMAFKQAEWDVITQLKSAYYDLFLNDRELEIQQEQVLWLNQAVASARARYATGSASQAELLRVQGEALEASNALTVLAHRRQAIAAHLNHLLDRPAHEPLGQPEMIRLVSLAVTPDELLLMAQERQPELLAMKYASERAEAEWKLAKRELLPDLETMLELRDPAMGPIGPWDLSLALVIPFWFWTKLQYGVKAALYDKDSMQAAYRAMQNEVARRIHEHWHEAMAAYTTAKLCRDGLIDLSRQTVVSATAAYQSGRGSLAELLDALRTLTERKRTYDQHLVAFEQHVVMLEQAVGIPLREAHEEPRSDE